MRYFKLNVIDKGYQMEHEGSNLDGFLAYNDEVFSGYYNSRIETSDFCFSVAEKGTIFSLIITDEFNVQGGVLVEMNIEGSEGVRTLIIEGKVEKSKMGLTGGNGRSRIYMFIPKSEALSPERIRNAEFEIVNLSSSDELDYMNDFKVVS